MRYSRRYPVIQTGGGSSAETLTPVAQTWANPFEARVGLSATKILPWEARLHLATTRLISFENLQRIPQKTWDSPYDVLQGIAKTNGTPYEAKGAISSTHSEPYENLKRISNVDRYMEEILADGPAAYYRMNEVSGNLQDYSGNGNHGDSAGGTPAYAVAGAIASDPSNDAITLDGSTEYFTVPDHASLDLGDVFTLEAWIKTNGQISTGTFWGIVSKQAGAYYMRVDQTGVLELNSSGTADIAYSNINVDDSLWHHVVATKNGTDIHLYIDGVDRTGTVNNATTTDNNSGLVIGADRTWSEWFNGTIDEVAIYDTALSQARVFAHYKAAQNTLNYENLKTVRAGDGYSGAFPTSGVLDTFTGSSESPITTNWTTPMESGGNPMSRMEGYLYGYGTAYYDLAKFGPDSEIYLDVTSVTVQNGYPIELNTNIDGEGTANITTYGGRFVKTATGWETGIFRVNASTVSWLEMDVSQAFTVANGDGIGMSVIGNIIRLYYRSGPTGDWVLVQDYDDSGAANKITTAGYIGLYNSDNIAHYDNFGGGNYVEATPDWTSSYDVLQGIAKTNGSPYEARGTVFNTYLKPYESLVPISAAKVNPYDLLHRISTSAIFGDIIDNFTGANETPITTNWSGPLFAGEGQLSRIGNQLKSQNADSYWSAGWYDVKTFGPDCEAQVTYTTAPIGQTLIWIRVTNQGTGTPYGYTTSYNAASGTISLNLYKSGDPYVVNLGSWASNWLGAGDRLGIRCIGSNIQAWKYTSGTWSLVGSAVDTTHAGSGYIGIEVNYPANILDDFGAATLSPLGLSYEAIQSLSSPKILPWESMQIAAVVADYILSWEALVALSLSSINSYENLVGLSTTKQSPFESLIKLAKTGEFPWEALQTEVVIADYVLAWEVLTGVRTTNITPFENIQKFAATFGVAHESLSPVAWASFTEYESLVGIQALRGIDYENSGWATSSYVLPAEALVNVSIMESLSYESIIYLALTGALSWEAIGFYFQYLRPDADIDTDQWQVAPLYPKVSDESDSTVITNTAQ